MKTKFSLFFCILLFVSCEDIFKVDDRNIIKLESNDDYITAITGVYGQLYKSVVAEETSFSGILKETIGNGDDINLFFKGFSENIRYKSYYYGLSSTFYYYGFSLDLGTYKVSGTDGGIIKNNYSSYKLLYQTIGDINNILSKSGDIRNLSSFKRSILGEAFFIRSYCYFRLVRVYGQIPIVANPDVDYSLKKPSFRELYNFIVSDLQKAIGLLPLTLKEVRVPYETPTIGSAKALLAEVYLTMGGYPLYDENGYANAAKTAGEVINNSKEYGFALVNDLADLWNGTHVKNSESVFSFYFSKDGISVNRNLYYHVCVPADFYNKFPKSYRKEVSFQTRHVPYILSNVLDGTIDSIYIKHYDTINYLVRINYKKYCTMFEIPDSELLSSQISISKSYTGQVVYILRYAQTLLTYAEAKARSGNLDGTAYEAINHVRRRANKVDISSSSSYDLKPGLSAEQFADSVVQERAWELCAEPEGRWFDMVRLNIAKDLVNIKYHQGIIVYPIPIDRTTYFLLIPEEDKKLNPNL